MFNIGPMEFVVIAIVGIVVIGPEKLPAFAKQAAQVLRTLRDLATGARQQLQDELGPEFSDVDLRNLNPRTAVKRAVFGDDDFSDFDPRKSMRKAVFGEEDPSDLDPRKAFRDSRDSYYEDYSAADSYEDAYDDGRTNGRANGHSNGHSNGSVSFEKPTSGPDLSKGPQRPRPRPRPSYSDDDVL